MTSTAAPFTPEPAPDLLRSGALVGRVDFALLAVLDVFDESPLGADSGLFQSQVWEPGAMGMVSGTAENGGGATAAILVPSAEDRTAPLCAML